MSGCCSTFGRPDEGDRRSRRGCSPAVPHQLPRRPGGVSQVQGGRRTGHRQGSAPAVVQRLPFLRAAGGCWLVCIDVGHICSRYMGLPCGMTGAGVVGTEVGGCCRFWVQACPARSRGVPVLLFPCWELCVWGAKTIDCGVKGMIRSLFWLSSPPLRPPD